MPGVKSLFSEFEIIENFNHNRLLVPNTDQYNDSIWYEVLPKNGFNYQASLTLNRYGRNKLHDELLNKKKYSTAFNEFILRR
jgi:hypothetical protein